MPTAPTPATLTAALDAMTRELSPYASGPDAKDWSVPARGLTWSCWTTAAHIGHDLLAYAGQVAGRPDDAYLPFDLRVQADATPARVLQITNAAGQLLATALAAADPGMRAWHWGPTDPAGFAAMGTAEVLLHTWDIAGGLGSQWTPPDALARPVLARLFPEIAPGPDEGAGDVLLWATGRLALPDRPQRTEWTWRAALAEEAVPAEEGVPGE